MTEATKVCKRIETTRLPLHSVRYTKRVLRARGVTAQVVRHRCARTMRRARHSTFSITRICNGAFA